MTAADHVLRVSSAAAAHIDAYYQYRNIVGEADGGKMMSDDEFEEYKKKTAAHRSGPNRLYVSWTNINTGMECRLIGPQSKCFCTHRYNSHAADNVADKRVHCRAPGCRCQLFDYIPVRGTQTMKCHCKHSFDEHDARTHRCATCSVCTKFNTSVSCSCGQPYSVHKTVFETQQERLAAGRPVDNLAGGGGSYAALGGITSFSSLVDGVDRYDGPTGVTSGVLLDDGGGSSSNRGKLTMADELDAFGVKYDRKSARPGITDSSATTCGDNDIPILADGSGGGSVAYGLLHTPHRWGTQQQSAAHTYGTRKVLTSTRSPMSSRDMRDTSGYSPPAPPMRTKTPVSGRRSSGSINGAVSASLSSRSVPTTSSHTHASAAGQNNNNRVTTTSTRTGPRQSSTYR